MAKNYGIGFCEKVLSNLREIEDKMFEEKGHGFDMYSEEFQTELKYKRLLKEFKREKERGVEPSYDPEIHGSFD